MRRTWKGQTKMMVSESFRLNMMEHDETLALGFQFSHLKCGDSILSPGWKGRVFFSRGKGKFKSSNFRNFIKRVSENPQISMVFEDAFSQIFHGISVFFWVAKDWYYQMSWGKLPQKPIISHTERQRQSRRSFAYEQRPLRWATRREAKTGASKGKGLWRFLYSKTTRWWIEWG